MKTAIVTGITGQDGAYLADYLLSLDYIVVGTHRRCSTPNFWRLEFLGIKDHPNLHLEDFDLTDLSCCIRLLSKFEPDEVYNLAAQSFVGVSFEQPIATSEMTGMSVTYLLEAIRIVDKKIKFYQASTSEMFGHVQAIPQSESTPFYPRSPYGVAKLYGHWMTVNYRESYDIFATSGILFNHESPLRGLEFVTRKITDGVSRIVNGSLDCLQLGNLDAKRDWGFAGDYVRGMHKMLQHGEPDTFVLASGRTETVRDFVRLAFNAGGIQLEFQGQGSNERAIDVATGKTVLKVDQRYYRPAEVDVLLGDASKAKLVLGWEATMTLEELCESMVQADVQRSE